MLSATVDQHEPCSTSPGDLSGPRQGGSDVASAEDRKWHNADALYLARRLSVLADPGSDPASIAVLDLGCGGGALLEQLADLGYDAYGYDIRGLEPEYDAERERRLRPVFGDAYDSHVRDTTSEREIPFDDDSFHVIHANQVFEHLRFLDATLGECKRVLKPGGTLLTNFPLATVPLEGHLGVPFVHWMPPGQLRLAYLALCTRLGILRPWREGWAPPVARTAYGNAKAWDRFLQGSTYYRFVNEIRQVALAHFEECELETKEFVAAKLDLMLAGDRAGRVRLARILRRLDRGGVVSALVTHTVNASFRMSRPLKSPVRDTDRRHRSMVSVAVAGAAAGSATPGRA